MDKIFPKIHNEGYKFIVIFIIATIILYFINGFLGFIGCWCFVDISLPPAHVLDRVGLFLLSLLQPSQSPLRFPIF